MRPFTRFVRSVFYTIYTILKIRRYIMGTTRQTLRLYWEVVSKHKPSFFVAFTAIPLGIMVTDTFLPYTLS